ncbi:ABC transporter permease [Luteimicrobium sp. DT211]|uniref:ABC transporter permease n=1 Tax=Luteimicrobium sp. DT211 TaxID=3393412 RepID=UPI003CF77FB6
MTAVSTTPVSPALPDTLDLAGTRPVPLTRLIRVEMRKMRDTRAGTWLLAVLGGVAVAVMVGVFIVGDANDRTFLDLLSVASIPLSFMLPVLGILLICSEWGQRTALVTFTLTPHRGRVLGAKIVAALLFALGAIAVAAVPAAILAAVGGADDPWSNVSVGLLARVLLAFVLGVAWGLAFGAALLNSALAIVAYFLVPVLVSIVGGIWTGIADKVVWFDLNQSSSALYGTDAMSGSDWAHIGTGVLLWIVLPGAIGTWRVLRSEVK